MKKQTSQELFLDETLKMAGFDPKEDDFKMLKEDMRPILNDYLETSLLWKISPKQRNEFFEGEHSLARFADKIEDFDDILADLYLSWQEDYLKEFEE